MRKLNIVNTTTNSIEMYTCHGWGCKTVRHCNCVIIYGWDSYNMSFSGWDTNDDRDNDYSWYK